MKGVLAALAALAAWWAPVPFESGAEAGARTGVRVGDRSRMHLSRPMRLAERRAILRRLAARPNHPGARASQPYAEQHQWFWRLHDPARGAASAARWDEPVQTLRNRHAEGRGLTPRARMRELAGRYAPLISDIAAKHKVSEALILAVIAVESNGSVQARSPKGAQGLMQLIPATADRFGVRDPYDPAQNIAGGVAYLDWLLGEFDGDAILALAGYNAGENAVIRHKGVPPYAETRDYVVKVLDAIVAIEALCAAPPRGPRRTCDLDLAPRVAPRDRLEDRAPPVVADPPRRGGAALTAVMPPPRPDRAQAPTPQAPARDIALPDAPPPGDGAS